MNARTSGQFLFAVHRPVVENPSQLLGGVPQKARLAAKFQTGKVTSAVTNGVLMVGFCGIPTQIAKAIIGGVAVAVATLHTFRAWTAKCLKYDYVKVSWKALTITAKAYQGIPVWAGLSVEDPRFSLKTGLRGSGTFNATKCADLVSVKFRNRSPLFSSYFFSGENLRSGSRFASFRQPRRMGLAVAVATFTREPISVSSVSVKGRSGFKGFTLRAGLFVYSWVSHACHAPNMMCVVRPVRLLAQSFGSLCILAQNA